MAHQWKYDAHLQPGLRHSIQVQTDTATADFNLLVLDDQGQVIAADRGPEPGARCVIETAKAQHIVIVVELLTGSGSFSLQLASEPSSKPAPSSKPLPKPAPSPTRSVRGGDAGSALTSAEADQLLAAHNQWRERYGVTLLQWSNDLAAFAQEWADELESTGMHMRHRSPNDHGENLYWCHGQAATADEVVDAWGNEDKQYDYATNNWWPDAGHFSQLVWHSTTHVGGAAVRLGGQELWVCNYSPRGNWSGQRPFEK